MSKVKKIMERRVRERKIVAVRDRGKCCFRRRGKEYGFKILGWNLFFQPLKSEAMQGPAEPVLALHSRRL
jgi:hypothetical protein